LGTLHEAPDPARLPPELLSFVDEHPAFVLFCPGGGGGHIEGRPVGDAFAEAARALHAPAVVVRGDWAAERIEHGDGVLRVGPLANAALMALLQRAELAVLGAGSLLLQALSLDVPCVAVALASDQSARLQMLKAHAAVIECQPRTESLTTAARQLWSDESQRQELRATSRNLGLQNGLEEALDALGALLSQPRVT
jgi:UDP:flavonoid glycosyltransferase YjiC (YdhE family)